MPKHNHDHIFEFDGIGTHWWITTFSRALSANEKEDILDIVRSFEADYSRFNNLSYIGQLNDTKTLTSPPSELVHMLRAAESYRHKTHGVFDIRVGKELEKLGYGRKLSDSARSSEENIDISAKQIRIGKDSRIDLGGIGKGWLIDKLSDHIAHSHSAFIVNGGGDIYIHGAPQTIALEHPMLGQQALGDIAITDKALAASSPLKRTWKHGDEQHHHIINPSTGHSESAFITSFVTGRSATLADVMATVLLLSDAPLRQHLVRTFSFEYLLIKPDFTFITSKDFAGQVYTKN